jgi:hypothetical protein
VEERPRSAGEPLGEPFLYARLTRVRGFCNGRLTSGRATSSAGSTRSEVGPVLDVAYLLLAAAGFVALALAVRGVERM